MAMMESGFDLNGKVAIVTGAGRGIGKSIAVGLAEYGADIVLCSRTLSELEQVAHKINTLERKTLPFVIDITQTSQIDHLISETQNQFKRIDILVNNAGAMLVSPALEVKESDWQQVMDTNVKAPFFLSQKVAQVMVQQGTGGSIINVTSEVVSKVEADLGAYCPSKAALHGITKTLAKEWGKYKIRVNSLAPCFVDTVLNQPLFAKREEFYEPKLQGVPLGRHSVPEDLVGSAIFLASAASSYITGTTILVDGGLTA
jgi:NAD(P)-dependent dehydrogenase (short-subunit alcohol dehydrogenase family)